MNATWYKAFEPLFRFNAVQIWRETELLAELRSKGGNEYYELDEKGVLAPRNGFTIQMTLSFDEQQTAFEPVLRFKRLNYKVSVRNALKRRKVFVSVVRKDDEKSSLEEQIEQQLKAAREQIDGFSMMSRYIRVEKAVHTVLHEVAEVAVLSQYLNNGDRRWFCEGLANFIAYRALVETTSPDQARRHYDLSDELLRWKGYEDKVDLDRWIAVEKQTIEEHDSDFDRARYAYATKAIANVYEKQGREFFPRWLREIARTPRKDASIATVHATFEQLTGEKLSSYYPRPLF